MELAEISSSMPQFGKSMRNLQRPHKDVVRPIASACSNEIDILGGIPHTLTAPTIPRTTGSRAVSQRYMLCHVICLSLFAACATGHSSTRYNDAPSPTAWSEGGWRRNSTIVFRVVDSHGKAVVGAEALATYEARHPVGGMLWQSGMATSDQYGLVVLSVRPDCDMVVVTAAGYSDFAEVPDACDLVVMEKASPVPVRVTDWRGRVAAGELGYTKYCGHRPDLETAQIASDGIALFQHIERVEPEVYARAPGLAAAYLEGQHIRRWRPGHPPVQYRLEWAPAVAGRVVDADGDPIAGAFVGGASLHRGPWTTAGVEGAFCLEGLPVGHPLFVDMGSQRYWFPSPPREGPCLLRLDHGTKQGEAFSAGALRVHITRDGMSIGDASPIVLSRLGAAQRTSGSVLDFWLPAGEHAVVYDEPLALTESDEVAATVTPGGGAECDLHLRARPQIRVVVRDLGDSRVTLATRRWSCDVTDCIGAPIPVPCDGDAAFWIGNCSYPLPRDFATRTSPIEIVAPRRAIVGRLLGYEDCLLAGSVQIQRDSERTATAGAFRLPIEADGGEHVLVLCADRIPDFRRILPVETPPSVDSRDYNVGDIHMWVGGPLCFYSAEGVRLREANGALVRDGRNLGIITAGCSFFEGPEPKSGDYVRIEWPQEDGDAPTRVLIPLDGPGPWNVHQPAGSVVFNVVDDLGRPIGCHVWEGLTSTWLAPEANRLPGMVAGHHRFVLSAVGCATCVIEVNLAEGEEQCVSVKLRHR